MTITTLLIMRGNKLHVLIEVDPSASQAVLLRMHVMCVCLVWLLCVLQPCCTTFSITFDKVGQLKKCSYLWQMYTLNINLITILCHWPRHAIPTAALWLTSAPPPSLTSPPCSHVILSTWHPSLTYTKSTDDSCLLEKENNTCSQVS